MPEQRIYGFVRPGFEAVRDAFVQNFLEGRERGASCSVIRHGETLVELWAGEQARGQPWRRDTLVNVFSTTKGAAALCCAILADRGLLDYNEKVSKYWPEFAAEGKGEVTVAEALSHQAGVTGIRHPDAGADGVAFTIEDLLDFDKTCAQVARQKPFWPPGSRNGYHALTYGNLAGELVRRISGETIGSFFRKNVAEPLGVDFYIGLPESEDHRVAPMLNPDTPSGGLTNSTDAATGIAAAKPEHRELLQAVRSSFTNPTLGSVDGVPVQNTTMWRRAEIPAANGHTNASALARMYCCLARGGELDSVRIISSGGVRAATRMNCFRKDLVLGFKVRWGMGFMLNDPLIGIQGPNLGAFGHSGAGGSVGFADPLHGLGFGYAMTQMTEGLNGDPRSLRLIEAVYGCLGQPMRYQRDKDGLPMQTLGLMSDVNGNLTSGGKPIAAKL